MITEFKVCGLTTPEGVDAAVSAGASYLGLVFYPRSPRHLTLDRAAALAARAPSGVRRVALVVDAPDAEIDAILDAVEVDVLQLHGAEPPERVAALAARRPVMKAVGVREAADLAALDAYPAAARLLVDAKPPPGAPLPGGNGEAFDWDLLSGRAWPMPWMLAGGLDPGTVAEAVRVTGAPCVDVSSGVESAPGVKDAGLIAAFAAALGGPQPGMRTVPPATSAVPPHPGVDGRSASKARSPG